MERIPGISVMFAVDDRVKPIAEDGFVGQFVPGQRIAVEARVSPEVKIYAISVDGKKNIAMKKDCTPAEEYATYRFGCRVKLTEDGRYHVEYPENNMRLVRVLDERVEIWQISVVGQNDNFFLVTEKSYDIYIGDGVIYYPKSFKKRPEYMKLLGNTSVEYQPEVSAYGLGKNQGRVLWWNSAQGVGAIITQEGVLRVYWEEVAKRPRLRLLIPGEIVKYSGIKLPVQTLRPTAFQKEAIEVKPLDRPQHF